MFTITGKLQNRPEEIKLTWKDDQILGDDLAVMNFTIAAAHREICHPLTGAVAKRDFYSNGLAAYILMQRLFDDVQVIEGEVPQAPPIPDGAVS